MIFLRKTIGVINLCNIIEILVSLEVYIIL